MAHPVGSEVAHWNEVERLSKQGARMFWLNHPRVGYHYHRKASIDGLPWQKCVVRALGHPARHALELGCGSGESLAATWRSGTALRLTGIDLDESRFAVVR